MTGTNYINDLVMSPVLLGLATQRRQVLVVINSF